MWQWVGIFSTRRGFEFLLRTAFQTAHAEKSSSSQADICLRQFKFSSILKYLIFFLHRNGLNWRRRDILSRLVNLSQSHWHSVCGAVVFCLLAKDTNIPPFIQRIFHPACYWDAWGFLEGSGCHCCWKWVWGLYFYEVIYETSGFSFCLHSHGYLVNESLPDSKRSLNAPFVLKSLNFEGSPAVPGQNLLLLAPHVFIHNIYIVAYLGFFSG